MTMDGPESTPNQPEINYTIFFNSENKNLYELNIFLLLIIKIDKYSLCYFKILIRVN